MTCLSRPAVLALFLVLCAPLRADPVSPDLGRLLEAMAMPYLQRAAFVDHLEAALDRFQPAPEPPVPSPAAGDPYFWSSEARFGLPMDAISAPGGVVTCARYGRITLERMQLLPSSDPQMFPLMRQAAILHDDASARPEHAVARLVCLITWDDARRVAPLDRDAVLAQLSARFTMIADAPDPAEEPGAVRVFGPGGYLIEALGGPASLGHVMDRVGISQTGTHQLILMRSYLLGGGV